MTVERFCPRLWNKIDFCSHFFSELIPTLTQICSLPRDGICPLKDPEIIFKDVGYRERFIIERKCENPDLPIHDKNPVAELAANLRAVRLTGA